MVHCPAGCCATPTTTRITGTESIVPAVGSFGTDGREAVCDTAVGLKERSVDGASVSFSLQRAWIRTDGADQAMS